MLAIGDQLADYYTTICLVLFFSGVACVLLAIFEKGGRREVLGLIGAALLFVLLVFAVGAPIVQSSR